MEHMGASLSEAPPTNVNRKDLTKTQQLEAISILRVKLTHGHFERGAIVDVTKRFNVHTPQFGDYGREWHACMW